MKKRTLTLVISLLLVALVAVGGTLAWLKAETTAVVNTFSPSDINVTLEETFNVDTNGDGKNDAWVEQMVPGHTITKDPLVTVKANSEEAMLFVKLEKSDNYNTYLENYAIAEGWTALPGVEGVYYREVVEDGDEQTLAADHAYGVLLNNQVKVKVGVTKEQMNALTDADNYPTLTVTAYATQLWKSNTEKFSPADAWTNAQPAN